MKTPKKHLLAFSLSCLASGCADTDDPFAPSKGDPGADTGDMGSTGADPACELGSAGCGCEAGGSCDAGLECIGGSVCGYPPEPSDPSAGSGMTMGSDDTGGTGACTGHEDCGAEEICSPEGECTGDVYAYCYELVVESFVPTSCSDGFGDKELFFTVFFDDANVLQSPTVGCPAAWASTVVEIPAWGSSPPAFQLDVWELDAFKDDYQGSLCFDDGTGACGGPLPGWLLHDGGVSADLSAGLLELSAELVPCP